MNIITKPDRNYHYRSFSLNEEDILTNDVNLTYGGPSIGSVKFYVITDENHPVVALWARNEQEALDEMVDQNYDRFIVPPEDVDEEAMEEGEYAFLGNAGEPADLEGAWVHDVCLDLDIPKEALESLGLTMAQFQQQQLRLIIALAEAKGGAYDNLSQT